MTDAHEPSTNTSTQFWEAVKAGDQATVGSLLQAQPDLVNSKDSSGISPLMTALYTGNSAMIDLLIANNAELDIFADAALGNTDAIERLLQQEPSLVNARSADGWTPLHLAAFFSRNQVADLLIAHGADIEARSSNAMQNLPIHAAVPNGNHELVSKLLASGADVNARQEGGWVALHEAALMGYTALVNLLLDHHADPHIENDQGQTALDVAEEKGQSEVASLLRQRMSSPA